MGKAHRLAHRPGYDPQSGQSERSDPLAHPACQIAREDLPLERVAVNDQGCDQRVEVADAQTVPGADGYECDVGAALLHFADRVLLAVDVADVPPALQVDAYGAARQLLDGSQIRLDIEAIERVDRGHRHRLRRLVAGTIHRRTPGHCE